MDKQGPRIYLKSKLEAVGLAIVLLPSFSNLDSKPAQPINDVCIFKKQVLVLHIGTKVKGI